MPGQELPIRPERFITKEGELEIELSPEAQKALEEIEKEEKADGHR